jgi:hypothetical protein
MRVWPSPAECENQRERAAVAAHQRILPLSLFSYRILPCLHQLSHWYPLAAADGLMSLRISFPSQFLFQFVNHRIFADLQLLVHIAVVIDYHKTIEG